IWFRRSTATRLGFVLSVRKKTRADWQRLFRTTRFSFLGSDSFSSGIQLLHRMEPFINQTATSVGMVDVFGHAAAPESANYFFVYESYMDRLLAKS
ncbi:unnamed protein product, partial [Brassica oleracea]